MGALSPTHLIVILVVALLVLGPGKLPETGEALGTALREFRRAMVDEPAADSADAAGRPSTSPAPGDAGSQSSRTSVRDA